MRSSHDAAMKLSDLAMKVVAQQRPCDEHGELSSVQIEMILSVAFETVAQRMLEGGSVYIHGFGTFSPKKIAGRHARDRAGCPPMWVPSHKVPSFRPSLSLSTRFKS